MSPLHVLEALLLIYVLVDLAYDLLAWRGLLEGWYSALQLRELRLLLSRTGTLFLDSDVRLAISMHHGALLARVCKVSEGRLARAVAVKLEVWQRCTLLEL